MDDLISKKAAIERFDCIRPCDPMTSDYTHGIDVGIALCKVAIREQPPAQLSTNLAEVGTDAVSRKSAIEIVEKYFKKIGLNGDICVDGLRQLPPIQPKRGRWISADAIFGGVPFYCSECGENTRDTVMGKPRWNFCPNCGAKMEVNHESN